MPLKLRTQKITIDIPTESSPIWVQAIMQKVWKDSEYQTQQTVDNTGRVYRELMSVVTESVTVTDPVTQQVLTASAGGITELLKALIITWMQQDFGGEVNEIGDLIIEE